MNHSLIPISATSQYTTNTLSPSPIKPTRKQENVDFNSIFQQVKLANSAEFKIEYQKVQISHELSGSYLKHLAYEEAHHKSNHVSMQGAVNLYTANSY